jgi:hypothetical protein
VPHILIHTYKTITILILRKLHAPACIDILLGSNLDITHKSEKGDRAKEWPKYSSPLKKYKKMFMGGYVEETVAKLEVFDG